MLKITISETLTEVRWVLQGRLAEPWVTELRLNWDKTRPEREGRKCVVDLSDVTCVGKGAEELLRCMSMEHAQLIASGLYIRHVLDELKNGKDHEKDSLVPEVMP